MEVEKERIAVSKFKATCLEVLRRVKRSGRPVVITRFDEAIAEIIPPTPPGREREWMGSMRDRGRIVGDIVAPASAPEDWEALGD
jgi:antitoxin (DNA-binding transcriptional repressor) of toxin-antitoxin stability system